MPLKRTTTTRSPVLLFFWCSCLESILEAQHYSLKSLESFTTKRWIRMHGRVVDQAKQANTLTHSNIGKTRSLTLAALCWVSTQIEATLRTNASFSKNLVVKDSKSLKPFLVKQSKGWTLCVVSLILAPYILSLRSEQRALDLCFVNCSLAPTLQPESVYCAYLILLAWVPRLNKLWGNLKPCLNSFHSKTHMMRMMLLASSA